MTKREFIYKVSRNMECDPYTVRDVLNAIIDTALDVLPKEEYIALGDLGKLRVFTRRPRSVWDINNQCYYTTEEKSVVKFIPSTKLKEAINQGGE